MSMMHWRGRGIGKGGVWYYPGVKREIEEKVLADPCLKEDQEISGRFEGYIHAQSSTCH